MFSRILVPLDRSDLAEQALGRATAMARASGAQLDLVLVHQPFAIGGFDDAPWESRTSQDEQSYLNAIVSDLASGESITPTHAILKGDPAEMICRRAEDSGADLVVMTSHGRTGLSRAWLGSVADGVVRRSGVPVLLLRPVEGKGRVGAASQLFNHLLVAIDGSAASASIISAAVQLASLSEARVTLVRIVRPIPLIIPEFGVPVMTPPIVPDEKLTQQVADEARTRLAELASRSSDHGISLDAQIVVNDHVAQAILDFAHAQNIDAIAMTTHGRGASRLVVGSIADKVLRATNLPMLLTRPKDDTAATMPSAPVDK